MRTIQIVAVGRLKEAGLRALCDDYYRRCSGYVEIRERELRDDRGLTRMFEEDGFTVVLDERGQQFTSRAFSRAVADWLDRARGSLQFVIGGADGISENHRRDAKAILSFGSMTFAHRLVRVMLAEQLYRAVSILQGTPYHRD